jgi:hypothetical protein
MLLKENYTGITSNLPPFSRACYLVVNFMDMVYNQQVMGHVMHVIWRNFKLAPLMIYN